MLYITNFSVNYIKHTYSEMGALFLGVFRYSTKSKITMLINERF